MGKLAWIEVDSMKHGKNADLGYCDMKRALSLFADFDQHDRSGCPTIEELTDGGVDSDEHLKLSVYFGDKPNWDHDGSKNIKCWLVAEALKPSGYDVCLKIPKSRRLLGLIPMASAQDYSTRNNVPVTGDQVSAMLEALYEMPEHKLETWVEAQVFLEQRK